MANRKEYDDELREINVLVHEMGKEVKKSIDRIIHAFSDKDAKLAAEVMERDDIIDKMETDIEERCIGIVVKQAPLASDWRKIASYMRMISDLERIADNSSDISIYILKLSKMPEVEAPAEFHRMFLTMREMVGNTIESFFTGNIDLAKDISAQDDIVDKGFDDIVEKITAKIQENPESTAQYVNYLMIAKYIERMADHSENIASWVTFIVKGQLNLKYTDRYQKESQQFQFYE
ncbi:MAG: phosphate signaling complex protein PhoU [Bilifractor sp.]|jgi:phosphate transport system protein